jgi:hypothetical protein
MSEIENITKDEPDHESELAADSGTTQPSPALEPVARKASPFRLYSAREILARPEPVYLVRGFLHAGSASMMFGYYGEGKTTVAQDLAFAIGSGLPWHGHEVHQGPVVYIAAEDDAFLGRQIRAWTQDRQIDELPDVRFIPAAPQLARGDVDDVIRQMGTLPTPPVLVIIDTFSATFVGFDENTQKDESKFNDAVNKIRRERGSAVMLIHHSGKKRDTERGNTALGANCDLMLKVEMVAATMKASPVRALALPRASCAQEDMRVGSGGSRSTSIVKITCTKNRRGPRHPPISFALKPVTIADVRDEFDDPIVTCVLDDVRGVGAGGASELTDNDRALLEVLAKLSAGSGGNVITSTAWEQASGKTSSTYHRSRRPLVEGEYVMYSVSPKGYTLSAKGAAEVGPKNMGGTAA